MLIKKLCLYCQKEFTRDLSPDNLKRGKGKYCSALCGQKDYSLKYKQGKIKVYWEGLVLGRKIRKEQGYISTIETRQKIANSLRGRTGKLARNFGHKHSKKTKQLIAQKAREQMKKQWKDPLWLEKHGEKKAISTCPICKEQFTYRLSKSKTYCSTKCSKQIPWNKGKKYSQIAGEKNNFWKGGITSLIEQIRSCLEYKLWVKNVFNRDNFVCQMCGQRGGNLHVNHIKKFSTIFEENGIKNINEALVCQEFWDISNGIVLCVFCHRQVTGHEKDWESYFNFNLKTRGFIYDEHILNKRLVKNMYDTNKITKEEL